MNLQVGLLGLSFAWRTNSRFKPLRGNGIPVLCLLHKDPGIYSGTGVSEACACHDYDLECFVTFNFAMIIPINLAQIMFRTRLVNVMITSILIFLFFITVTVSTSVISYHCSQSPPSSSVAASAVQRVPRRQTASEHS